MKKNKNCNFFWMKIKMHPKYFLYIFFCIFFGGGDVTSESDMILVQGTESILTPTITPSFILHNIQALKMITKFKY